ncbi:helix-turn-helix transcriptional regulator [Roseateles saccharophilus]|uniref:Regulatory LuxR family protein n=1 Tax=Roseateles saccharophilus TaxID=304 RepID=A0A4R3UHF6_ROSSA|nr:LuxR family transcriptional regulator [Roseateles saccharophilus]MDG0834850.1 LuxR family transcriptional regulator [Roseateles saccharophilus]TCU88384.1 regulatory LuxR family protein [Roseateles saccharophilus]
MSSSPRTADLSDSTAQADTAEPVLRVVQYLPRIRQAGSAESAVAVFRHLLGMLGADGGIFLSVITDDAMRTSVRSLLACDPRWVIEYSRDGWHDRDPWLRYAMDCQTPVRSAELFVHPWEEEFAMKASTLGFASAVVVPAPTSFGAARVGVLVLGSNNAGHYDGEDYQLVQIVARALAMELHEWLLRTIRDDLLARSRITPDQIELLRYEAAGRSSKSIAAELGINPKAVDRRFQRVCEKLDAPDRRIAVRIARLYDLI